MYDLVIVGAGPAGVAAGVYAARKHLKTALITDSWGGQSLISDEIQNWIGDQKLSGYDLAKKLEGHLRVYPQVEIIDPDLVTKVESTAGGFKVLTKEGKTLETKTVLLSSGGRHKRLGIPGEDQFDGKGVAYCAICDAPLFRGKIVAVVGGGNAGLEAVVDLFPYAEKIYLLHRYDQPKGDPVTQKQVLENPKVQFLSSTEPREILGEKFVTGLIYEDLRTKERKNLAVQGVFVEIGSTPNSEMVKELINMDQWGNIIADPVTQRTSVLGIWAVGDVTSAPYRQNNISSGDAIKALLNIDEYLKGIKKEPSA